MQRSLSLRLAAVILGLTAALAVPSFAQFAPQPHHAHGQGLGKMKKLTAELNLTESQKTQLKPLLRDARRQARAIKQDTALTAETRKAKMKELRRNTRRQMLTVLTPEQRGKLKDLRGRRGGAKGDKA